MGKKIGKVTHYFTDIGVGIIDLKGDLKVGEEIQFKGATTDFKQEVESMEIDHEEVKEAKPGQKVGLKVENRVREGDKVLKVK